MGRPWWYPKKGKGGFDVTWDHLGDALESYNPLARAFLRGEKKLEEAKRLIGLALDFWSAPGIDMPSIDTFDDMVGFMGKSWSGKWTNDGKYTGEPIKPVGMTGAEHDAREKKDKPCTCLPKAQKTLREQGVALVTKLAFSTDPKAKISVSPPLLQVRKAGNKLKGKRLPVMVCTYCPFCGKKYEK